MDIKAILEELGIDYKENGKNVGTNDINIDCPFCGADKHLGINKKTGKVWCWVCEFIDSKRIDLISVLVEITGERWIKIKNLLNEYGWEDDKESFPYNIYLSNKCKLPDGTFGFDSPDAERAKKYLYKRGFNDSIIDKYELKVSPDYGYYANRIIVPVFFKDEMVAFTARDYTNNGNRYINSASDNSTYPMKNLLYNYNKAIEFKHIYILEGVTDVWKMGDDSVGIFKSTLSKAQRKLIIDMNLESITIIFDPLATTRAIMAALDLEPFIKKIKVVRLEGIRDVGDMSRDEVLGYEKETKYFKG